MLVVNVGAIVGIGASLFVVPRKTPFWLWATIAGATLLAMNIYLYCQKDLSKPHSKASSKTWQIAGLLGFGLFIVDIILSQYFR